MDSDIKRLFGREPEEMVIEIEIERLRDFKNHPFKIRDDLQMRSLKESIPESFEIVLENRRIVACKDRDRYSVQRCK